MPRLRSTSEETLTPTCGWPQARQSLPIGSTHECPRVWPTGDSICSASPLLQRDDCIAAYYFHKPAMRDGESNER